MQRAALRIEDQGASYGSVSVHADLLRLQYLGKGCHGVSARSLRESFGSDG